MKAGILAGAICACAVGGVLNAEPSLANVGQSVTVDPGTILSVPDGMAAIPAGNFTMGDSFAEGDEHERPIHTVFVSGIWMERHEVSKSQWNEVRAWGVTNGYTDLAVGIGKAVNHTVHTVSWYDCVKWCNARSQREGLMPCYTVNGETYRIGSTAPECDWNASGYRLPTEAEWEKAARGGASGRRFSWVDSDTIQHGRANYRSSHSSSYDASPSSKFHPAHGSGDSTHTSPVGSFEANGYGLFDMAGNVFEWCWDWYSANYYSSASACNPHGPASGEIRIFRGGCWNSPASQCRVSQRSAFTTPGNSGFGLGFRTVRTIPQTDARK